MDFAILHVDDHPGERLLVAEAFRERGTSCQLFAADDGYDALTLLQRWADQRQPMVPAVILLDISMPRMDGLELLVRLKQHPVWHAIPVVMLTNSQRLQERQAAEGLGSSAFEVKPASFEGYVALVHRLEALAPDIMPPGEVCGH